MKNVAWSRPVENNSGNLVYTSKDGRFTITKRKFVLPYACFAYILEGEGVPRWARDNDTLADAKAVVQDLVASK